MTQSQAGPLYGVGGCGTCRHVFLVTPELRSCPLCDRPPDRVLAFAEAVAATVAAVEVALGESEEADAPIPYSVTCPHCDQEVLLEVTAEAITVIAPSHAPPEEWPEAPKVEPEPPAPPLEEEEEAQEPLVAPQEGPPPEAGEG